MRKAYPEPIFDDAVDARRAAEEEAARRREEKRQRIREAFPEMTAFADQFREVFGPETRLKWAVEGGNVVGNPPGDVVQEHEAKHGPLRRIA